MTGVTRPLDRFPLIRTHSVEEMCAALARIYPGRDIRCALLWTQGPLLMPISPERLAGHLP